MPCQRHPSGVKNHVPLNSHLTAFSWKSPVSENAVLSGVRSVRLIQHFPQFMRQCGRRERFLKKCHAFVQHALMDDGILGIGGSEKNFCLQMQRMNAVGQLLAAHMWHHNVRE